MSSNIIHIQSVAHEGKVVVVGTDTEGYLFYTIRQSGFEDTVIKSQISSEQLPGFEPWKSLILDNSVDDSSVRFYQTANFSDKNGVPLVESIYEDAASRSAVAQVKMLSCLGHLYLFRVSAKGRLLMNRFILDGITNELIPKLEVRYRRSQKKLTPEGGTSKNQNGTNQDSLEYKDINDQPFYEPALQLNFLGEFHKEKPWFSVELLNTNEHDKHVWHFFVYTNEQLKVISVGASSEGLVNLNDNVKILTDPEDDSKKIMRRIAGLNQRVLELPDNLVLSNQFDSSVYNNQFEKQTKAGPQLVKDATRLMLSLPVISQGDQKQSIAAISFGVNNIGMLSQIDFIRDDLEEIRSDKKELVLPLNTLDEIKLIADLTPTPSGRISKFAQADENLVAISSVQTIDDVEVGKQVKISGTRSYNGIYTAKNVGDKTFEIEASFDTEDDKGYWEVVEEDNTGLVFENMIASYEKTETGEIQVSCLAHNLQEGDEIRIKGSAGHDGTYPIRNKSEANEFIIDADWNAGEVVNLTRVKRRGLYFDGNQDCLVTDPIEFKRPGVAHNIERTISAWIYLDAITDQNQYVFHSATDDLFKLYVDKQGELNFDVRFMDGYNGKVQESTPLPTDTWVHVCAIFNYKGESTGETQLTILRNGEISAEKVIQPIKPLHLDTNSLKLNKEFLPVNKLHYSKPNEINEITVEAWVNTKQDGYGVIASWDRSEYWRLGITGNKTKRVLHWCTRAEGIHDQEGQIHIKDNHWYHVAATYNATTGEKRIYVNGELDSMVQAHDHKGLGTGAVRYGFIGVGSEAESFAGAHNGGTEYDGFIADVRIWHKEINQESIQQNRASKLTGLEEGLVGYWLLEPTTATKVMDGTRTKAHLRMTTPKKWAPAYHRMPGRKELLENELYQQQFSAAAKVAIKSGQYTASEEFKGKISGLQLWTLYRGTENIRSTMYDKPTGGELGLAGYWPLGGIVHELNETTGVDQRITPDFSTSSADAVVLGETYVSACDLFRSNSLGKAVSFSNNELVAVSQGATYEEFFEFRAVDEEGEFLTLDQVIDADGANHPIFQFNYWGKKARTSEEKIQFDKGNWSQNAFKDLGNGWFQAHATVTIPEGVNMIRTFELNNVKGKWQDEMEAPEGEWQVINVRKHGIRLVSNSITKEKFTDELELPVLADNAQSLADAIRDIPNVESTLSNKRIKLNEVLEEIELYENVQKFVNERDSLKKSTEASAKTIKSLSSQLKNYPTNPLNYMMLWKAKEAGRVLDLSNNKSGSQVYIYGEHFGQNQVWEFILQSDGSYKIKCCSNGQWLTGTGQGKTVYIKGGDSKEQYWTVTHRGGGYYSIHNKANGKVLDVYGHGKANKSTVVLWPYNGQNNQMWNLMRYYPKMNELMHLKALSQQPLHGKIFKQQYDAIFKMIKASHPYGVKKSTFDSEFESIKKRLDRLSTQYKTENARLKLVSRLLDSRSEARFKQLKTIKASLTKEIVTIESQLIKLNGEYTKLAKSFINDPQTMALIAKDGQNLNTYGAVLAFASPASSIASNASAEGNVQLSYFDQEGRIRFTQYDATADTTNSSFEQWLPTSATLCPELKEGSRLTVSGKKSIELPETGYTIESWFFYPPAFKEDGTPYFLNKLSSNADGKDAVIAIMENKRLGTLVDGFFHDSGWDLETNLGTGWHHVAAVATNGVCKFYVDGNPVGLSIENQQAMARQAIEFNGRNDYVQVPEINDNFSSGITLQGWVRFDRFNKWSRVMDFGNGTDKDNIVIANSSTSNTLAFDTRNGSGGATQLTASNVLTAGEWCHIAGTIDSTGTASLYLNGKEVAFGTLKLPASIKRSKNYIGRSNWSGDKYFDGAICELQIWNRSLSANEIRGYMLTPPEGNEVGLVHYWEGKSKDVNGKVVAFDSVESNPRHGDLKNGADSIVLEKMSKEPIVHLGNSADCKSPIGKMSEFRIWNQSLSDEEIRINSRLKLTGNEPDLLAYYPLNDVTSNSAKDITLDPLHLDCIKVAAVACSAPMGNPGSKVFQFDGHNDYLTLSGINIAKRDFTVEFWCKREELSHDDWIIMQGENKAHKGLHLGFRANNQYAFAFYGNDLNTQKLFGAGQWLHVANTYEAKTKTQKVFINGKLLQSRKAPAHFQGTGDLLIGKRRDVKDSVIGQLSELRIWNKCLSDTDVANGYNKRALGNEKGLMVCIPFTDENASNIVSRGKQPKITGTRLVSTNDLPIVQGDSVVTDEYNTVGLNPAVPNQKRAMLRRFVGFSDYAGQTKLFTGKRIEELQLKWIGNAQFEPTLLGFIEGAPPVPSENLTVNYDYDGATSVQLTQSEDTSYSWMRTKDVSQGVDLNLFLGAGWGAEGGFGVVSKISEGKAGFRGMMNLRDGTSKNSTIRASSTNILSDRLELRGAYEVEPQFPHLGNRYVPKNVGYALVVSGLADVFVTQMKRTGRMVGYEILPVEDVPLDVNTITFMINPNYSINGSLDGMVGSQAADQKFCKDVPQMRAQYGSLYPSGYYNLSQAYDLKAQIDRWDKERESYFVNFDATQTTVASLENQTADDDEYDNYGSVEVNNTESADTEDTRSEQDVRNEAMDSYKSQKSKAKSDGKKRKEEISKRIDDQNKQLEASAAFDAWQKRMENLQIRAAKRNIVNTYVWDADGGMRSEEQNFANTVEHTVGGNFSISGSAGFDTDVMVTGFKFELQALYAGEMTQTMSKTLSSTTGFDLNIRLDGVEKKGVTDAKDYPIQPGEKVDRYRFMSYYLEGNTDHFHDFFSHVVDPEWLMSNDEEARALRQVSKGRANKCWRVMHRVTYVERPALMGFGQDLRVENDSDAASQEVFNYFDALEQSSDQLRADISELKSQLTSLEGKIEQISTDKDKA